ncbi:Isotrichodermin C-15 hydroxylase [Fusarium sp. LHS14.1]|nr:Isotrichodermin C-15 hydroxylase [Fusarium sp. LHS14.1]
MTPTFLYLENLSVTVGLLYAAPVLLLLRVVYLTLSSPLRRIPGPWYNYFTSLVLTFHTFRGRCIFYVDDLHKKYGPVVRISYDEVDVSDVKGFKTIHKIGNG